MAELKEWLKYWRKTIAKCAKIHKGSREHKAAYAELGAYLDKIEKYAGKGELEAAVLSAVGFMQRMYELEQSMGLHVVRKKVPPAESR